MIIKTSDGRADDITALCALQKRSDLTATQRKQVARELVQLRSGVKGEREAAYHIDFHFGDTDNYAVIHDLRIEHAGRVAQIDHLVMGRFLNSFVCETKYWSNGVSINEHGEFTAIYGDHRIGVPSPIMQNARHICVLNVLVRSGRVQRPKRLGVKLPFVFAPVTLVSTGATIERPNGQSRDVFTEVIKADQFYDYTQSHFDENLKARMIGKLVSRDTLEAVAQSIASLHTPIVTDYAAKFGIAPLRNKPAAKVTKRYHCATCASEVEIKVARFCWFNKDRFNGEIRCRTHQAC